MTAFYDFLRRRLDESGFASEDAAAALLPLVRQTIEAHAAGFVAPLEGVEALQVEGNRLWFEESRREALLDAGEAIRRLESTARAVEVVGEYRVVTDVDEGTRTADDLAIGDPELPIERPLYLPDWGSWERRLGHRDPVTDVFSLGMILASLACNLDFRERNDLETFVRHRKNLFEIVPLLHPSLARLIVRMTELDRRRRPQDLPTLLRELENYRDRGVDLETQLAQDAAFRTNDRRTKQAVVLRKLRERLFEISRRNRLLDFKATTDSLNLTQASVPLSFDVQNVRPDQLLVWTEGVQQELADGKALSLDRYLNFAEALYVPSVLDRIAAESRRDRAEYGFAQLRLVACFLRWTDLKEKPIQRFDSPLVLVPVELVKKKGVRDAYFLRPLSGEGELNPVVRYRLKQLYDIDLPATVDLATFRLDDLHELLERQVRASEPGVAVEKIDKPRITLIHEKARRRLDQYRRTARLSGRGVRRQFDLDYSYDPANYHPLGLKLFSAKIRPPQSRLRTLLEERPRPRTFVVPEAEAPVVEREKSFYSLAAADANPYAWEFDLCSVTLANFRYRRMSLVRDYDALVDSDDVNPAFDATFSLDPKKPPAAIPETPPLSERFDVLPCDPTQASAVAQARGGASYIVQGPPGTGKSQTIANLIADYVARGKRVLFVCEKRAAIDVVFVRLKQCGLGELCCLIHDSQTDKKEFVMDLKATYEAFSSPASGAAERGREDVLARLTEESAPLQSFDRLMRTPTTEAGETLRETIEAAIASRSVRPDLSALDRERLPRYAEWSAAREALRRFETALRAIRPDAVFARHPLSLASPRIADRERPLAHLAAALDAALAALSEARRRLEESGVAQDRWTSLADARALADYAAAVDSLATIERLSLLDRGSEMSRAFEAGSAEIAAKRRSVDELAETAGRWTTRLPEADLAAAIEQAKRFEGSWFPWLQPAWWRLRGVLTRSYDFRAHTVRPSWAQALAGLAEIYGRDRIVSDATRTLQDRIGFTEDVEAFRSRLEQLRDRVLRLEPKVALTHRDLLVATDARSIVARLVAAREPVEQAIVSLDEATEGYLARTLDDLQRSVERARRAVDELPTFLPCLKSLGILPATVAAAFRDLELTPAQLEAATVDREVTQRLREDPVAERLDGSAVAQQAQAVATLYDRLLVANAAGVRRRVETRFRDRLRICATPAGQLTDEEKTLKKSYQQGRRELEREFNKSMRFRAIRELVSGDSGAVVRDLKPVWLMSPVSVSDTLPLDDGQFDVVIFDEASQIPLEEAAPSLFRARQAIVVGDQMQLPPTAFFASTSEDDEELLVEHEGELVAYDLESASFLGHAARNLDSTMLGWHYRSRSESLISFSNWAFYDGRLLTVPEERLPGEGRRPIVVPPPQAPADRTAEDSPSEEQTPGDGGETGAAELLARAISFHYLPHGVYDRRRNPAEAEHVAATLRALLRRRSGLTFGVVAFSETQQSEIEGALDRLAETDREFRDLLDAEREREENGQFVGLLVKNLENIQGDERDVILLSVCYGRDPAGATRMNFGPINQSGGEKRLNVAFSRAKRHMAVFSSIRHSEVRNDYNEGANCFKNYLKYAEAMSEGDVATASRVLAGLSRWREEPADRDRVRDRVRDPLAEGIAAALEERGWIVDRNVGQSHFRCDLAVRRPGDSEYRLGILLDSADRYELSEPLERDVQRPRLLQEFGWNVDRVLASEWFRDAASTIERLEHRLQADASRVASM